MTLVTSASVEDQQGVLLWLVFCPEARPVVPFSIDTRPLAWVPGDRSSGAGTRVHYEGELRNLEGQEGEKSAQEPHQGAHQSGGSCAGLLP